MATQQRPSIRYQPQADVPFVAHRQSVYGFSRMAVGSMIAVNGDPSSLRRAARAASTFSRRHPEIQLVWSRDLHKADLLRIYRVANALETRTAAPLAAKPTTIRQVHSDDDFSDEERETLQAMIDDPERMMAELFKPS